MRPPAPSARALFVARTWLSGVLAYLLALLATACAPRLAGTNDAALTCALDGDPAAAGGAPERVKARLASAQVPAQVDATPEGGVRVVVDADVAAAVDDLRTVASGKGRETRSPAPSAKRRPRARARADPRAGRPRPARRVETSRTGGEPGARPRIRAPRDRPDRPHRREPPPLVLRRRPRGLRARGALEAAALVSGAPRAAQDLDGAAPGSLGDRRRLHLLPFFLSLAWLAFVRRFDRARPEPIWLVLATFALGAASVVPAALVESGLAAVYAMGRKLVSRRTSVLAFFALAAVAHGAFDTCLSIEGAQLFAAPIVVLLALAFVAMLREALRHGAVRARGRRGGETAPETEPAPPSSMNRLCFPVGAPWAFYGCAATMIATASALTVLCAAYELLQHRAGAVFVALATALLSLFGVAAYFVSVTLPLDVVLDAQGITFAGSLTPWRTVSGLDIQRAGRSRAFVRVRRSDGVIRLGPTRRENAIALADAIAHTAGL